MNIFLSRADVAADVERKKTTALRGDIWDRHVSHNIYMRTCECASVSARA